MKKVLFLIGGLLSSWAISAQIMSQRDVATLASQEEINGTARYNSMSGAFGALGGDMSAADVNPAGLAVFKRSRGSISLLRRNSKIDASFAGKDYNFQDSFINANQIGGVLVIDTHSRSNWKKIALGINHSTSKDLENLYTVEGNVDDISNNAGSIYISQFKNPLKQDINLVDDPYRNFDSDSNNDIEYKNYENQFFKNSTNGKNQKTTFTLSGQNGKHLYLGMSLVLHSLDFYQNTIFEHRANDGNGNTIDAKLTQELRTIGVGASVNMGAIFKPTQNIRLGIAYSSPTWFEAKDEYADDLNIKLSNTTSIYGENNGKNASEYKFQTPSKLTGSAAFLFGKQGLISIDYSLKDYNNIRLKPNNDFNQDNQSISKELKTASHIKIGTEWRFDKVSIRGGFSFEESPQKSAIDTDHIKSISAGIGFKLGKRSRLDFAYQSANNTGIYNFADAENFPGAELNLTTSKITASLILGL